MDRALMYNDVLDENYIQGVRKFCKMAAENLTPAAKGYILCPCKDCRNTLKYRGTEKMFDHLTRRGFMEDYKDISRWHGESSVNIADFTTQSNGEDTEPVFEEIMDICDETHESVESDTDDDHLDAMLEDVDRHFNTKPNAYKNLLDASKAPLFPGCDPLKQNKLSFVMKLVNCKSMFGWSDVSFDALLNILKENYPEPNELPTTTYAAKKLLCPMEMGYKKIHACPTGCILYWKQYEDDESCPKCGEPRYVNKEGSGTKVGSPAKVLWYLPIIPRFKRLFAIEKDAENLRWHANKRKKDGKLRHPADSPQWRNIDRRYAQFSRDSRNLRLGLCTDGMNPYGTLSSIHSTWPVLLVIYNLPPWLCMKPRHIMLSLLISGPKQPGNKIDVFLQPLIDDLQLLWNEGVEVYDSFGKENFNLHAMLFCTINDFPAYGNLSGYTNKGKCACPICEEKTCSLRLKHCGKHVYMGHRKHLPKGHKYRRMTKEFNGKTEHGVAPKPLSGQQIYNKVDGIVNNFGPPLKGVVTSIWKKKSIFWELEYWKHLEVRHCIDGMHVEKNVSESFSGTLLNIKGKTKDHLKSRKDMVELGIRNNLAPQEVGKRTFLPPAGYTLSKEEKRSLCYSLYNIKVPSGYSSNIKSLVSMSELKLIGMKSHDHHVLLQEFLPIAIRGILPDNVRSTITSFCYFFKAISSKVLDVETLDKLQANLVMTLCQLEMYFPPSFFDIMVHLVVHLVREIKECGPMYLRYMYPFERYMGILKKKMKNRRHPEGSIIEGTTTEEAVDFCTQYLAGVDTIGLPKSRHEGRLKGFGVIGKKLHRADTVMLDKAHMLVLKHTEGMEPYFVEHLAGLREENPSMSDIWLQNEQNRTFSKWLNQKAISDDSSCMSTQVKWLAFKPSLDVVSYEGYDVNGYTFYTERRDSKSSVQNSGVHVVAYLDMYKNAKDCNPVSTKKSFYGVVQDIWVLDYTEYEQCVFQCKWIDNKHGYHEEDQGMTQVVDLSTATPTMDPFILASSAKQVFYIQDPSNSKLSIIRSGKRSIVGLGNVVDEEDYDMGEENQPLPTKLPIEDDDSSLVEVEYSRKHGEGIWIV